MEPKAPHIVIIDDDPVFGRLVESVGRSEGLAVSFCASIECLQALDQHAIDVLVVDFNLGLTNGIKLGFEWEQALPHVPMIIVSQGQDVFKERIWPASVKGFVDKKIGPMAIIETALAAYQQYGVPRPQTGDFDDESSYTREPMLSP